MITAKELFFSCFFIWFFLLILLGDTFLSYYIFAFGSLLIVAFDYFFQKKYQVQIKTQTQIDFYLILCLLFGLSLLISAFYTEYLPITFYKLSFFGCSYLVFNFFKKYSSILRFGEFASFLLLLSVILSFFSMFFLFFPRWGHTLPGLNLLFSSYGHNHLASFLLLTLPLAWFQLIKFKKNEGGWAHLLTAVFLSFMLLISFGRTAVFLGFCQLIIFAFLYRHEHKSTWYKFLLGIIALFVLALFFKLFLSLAPIWINDYQCVFKATSLENKLCKRIDQEPRLYYWQQAFGLFLTSSLVGHGPGTYPYLSLRFVQLPFYQSAHPHNFYLRTLAEQGLLGFGLLIIIIGLFLYQLRSSFNKKNTNQFVLILGLGASLINVFFDFDWIFAGIFNLSLIYFVYLINDFESLTLFLNKKIQAWTIKFNQICFYCVAIFLVGLGSLYALTNFLLSQGKINAVVETWPFFHWHSQIFAQAESITKESRDKVLKIYQNDVKFLQSSLTLTDDLSQKIILRDYLRKVDPWLWSREHNLTNYLVLENLAKAREEADFLFNYILTKQKEYQYVFDEAYLRDTAQLFFELARSFYLQENYQLSVQYLIKAQKLDAWILQREPPFVEIIDQENYVKQIEFLKKLQSIEPKYFGSKKQDFANLYLVAIRLLINDRMAIQNFAKIIDLGKLLVEIAPAKRWELWRLFFKNGAITRAGKQNLVGLANLINEFNHYSHEWDYQEKKQLRVLLIKKVAQDLSIKEAEKEELIQAIYNLDKQNYWQVAWPGFYFLKNGEINQAQVYFQKCQADFALIEKEHTDCELGLSLSQQNSDYLQYRKNWIEIKYNQVLKQLR